MVTKKDLSNQILNKNRVGEYLFCIGCGGAFSANAGDYWNVSDDYVFECECGCNLSLCKKNTSIEILKS